jgi:hypothetical protein
MVKQQRSWMIISQKAIEGRTESPGKLQKAMEHYRIIEKTMEGHRRPQKAIESETEGRRKPRIMFSRSYQNFLELSRRLPKEANIW